MSSTVEQVGRVIGGRYRLLAVVGAGASAQVFAADDTRLGRRVAVKLLHPALAGDTTFLRKFQAEARLAASLNHRNVLHVYDWGDEDGIPYLVLEYLGGGSLRSLLDTGYLLSPQQAAAVGAEAANGLAYAHRRGLVHRDIKPANLLFDDDGRLLVADFGLARALAEAAVTEPLGTVMGTARYASPEQVEGRPVDDRTDVYSLALTLYESVTGRVPFAGETTVATLMARVGAVLPPARELGPLAPVLAQAAIAEPLARLDAGALAYELELLLLELDEPDPLPLTRLYIAVPNLARGLGRDPTERFGFLVANGAENATAPPALEPTQVALTPTEPAEGAPSASEAREQVRSREEGDVQAPQGVRPETSQREPATASASRPLPVEPPPLTKTASTPPPAATQESSLPGVRRITTAVAVPVQPAPKRRKQRWLPWLLVLLVLELIGGGIVIAKSPFSVVHHDTVPPVLGLQNLAARAAITRVGLYPELTAEQYSQLLGRGAVISQSPRAGTREKASSIVKFVISLGPHPTALPSLSGLTKTSAAAALVKAHLVASFSVQYSETVPADVVVRWSSPKGTRVFYGDGVDVVISKGPMPQTIPSELGGGVRSWTQAQAALSDLHLVAVENLRYSTTIPAGYVVTTEPAPGMVVPGHTKVLVFVSEGPPYVTVPHVYGESATTAEQALTALGLKWVPFGPAGAGTVLTTLPLPGQSVRYGTTVDIYLY